MKILPFFQKENKRRKLKVPDIHVLIYTYTIVDSSSIFKGVYFSYRVRYESMAETTRIMNGLYASSAFKSETETSFNLSIETVDHVRWLINNQSFNGAWSMTDNDIQQLTGGKSLATFQSEISDIDDVITTGIAIAVLEQKYADQQDLWHAVVEKGRKQTINLGLTQDKIDLLINEIKNKL